MSKESVSYTITITRSDSKEFRNNISEPEGRHTSLSTHFWSDKYLSLEYIENLRRAIFVLLDGETELYHKNKNYAKPKVCAACHQDLTEIQQ